MRKALPLVIIIFFILSFALIPAGGAMAQEDPLDPSKGLVPCGTATTPDCNLCYLGTLIQNVINFAVAFSVVVATLMFVYAGFLYLTAGANEGQITKANGIFWKVFLGIVFILSAWLIVDTIMRTFVGDDQGKEKFGRPWTQLCK